MVCTTWHRVSTSPALGSYTRRSLFDTKLLTPVTVTPRSHTSLTSDFSLLSIYLLFHHTEVVISLTFILRARKSHGPISNINLTQTSSITSHDLHKVCTATYSFASELFSGSDLHLPHCGFCRVIDGRKECSNEIILWCEREQNENEMKHEVWLNLMKALRLLWWIMSLFWKRKLRSLPSPREKCIYLHK